MIEIIENLLKQFPMVGVILLVVYGFGYLTPLFICSMTLKFNKLTKFGVLNYFCFIFVCLCNYFPLFNKKIVESSEFQIITGISYLIFIVVSIVVICFPDEKQPLIYNEKELYDEEKEGK